MRALHPAVIEHAADARMVRMLLRSRAAGARLHVVAPHGPAEEQAHALLEAVRAEAEPVSRWVAGFGASMAWTHRPGSHRALLVVVVGP